MLGTVRHRIAQSLTRTKLPVVYPYSISLRQPAIEQRPLDIPSAFTSDNMCLQMAESIVDTVIHVNQTDSSIGLLIERLGEQERLETLIPPQLIEKLETLHSRVSEDLLPVKPYILKPTADFILGVPQLSTNLFTPLGRFHTDGRDYRRFEREQETLFGEGEQLGSQSTQHIRKAYSVRRTSRSTSEKRQSFWDLIFPILLPPLTFDGTEQFDLYGTLFPFQYKGIEFLIGSTSALLADEMGTGKTVQAILALRILFRQSKVKHALIVCPPAVLGSAYLTQITGKPEGWDGHLHKWAPELSVTVVRGNPEQRRLDWSCPAHVYISTYDTLRNDLESGLLEPKEAAKFQCTIIDEAQNIKNRDSGRAKAVRRLTPSFRWALTGTPIENNVEDVISIFSFVKPKLFGREYYSPLYVKNEISPFFLRRLKKDVLKELPEKIRQEEWLELDGDQRKAYDQVLETGQRQLTDKVKTESEFQVRSHIFALLTELKQICNFAPNRSTSAKTEALLDLLEEIAENHEQVLVFTQYVKYGIKKLEDFLQKNQIKYVSFYGDTSQHDRERAIQSFRSDPSTTVFLSAVKSGGVGITLTEASYVIHFDHWWNPASMWQAEDRAHRPGQKNKLNIYSFWMKDTVEEKIKQKLHEKGLLINTVIDSLATEVMEETITTEEWLEILGVKKESKRQKSEQGESLQSILEKLTRISPTEFEEISKAFFVKQGYLNSKVTQQTHDGGVDVFGSRKRDEVEESFIAQCKRTSSVGVKVARELLGVLAANPTVSNGFIITSGDFTEECLRFAEGNPKLTLINGTTFANFLRQFGIV